MIILLSQHHFTFTSFIILMFVAPMCYCQDEVDVYEVCSRTFDCGNLKSLSYPFWSKNGNRPLFCGEEVYNLSCREGQDPSIIFESLQFNVSNINLSANMITVSLGDICPVIGFPITARLIRLNETLSGYGDGLQNISFFYECISVPRTIRRQNIFECPRFNDRRHAFFTNDTQTQLDTGQCLKTVEVPVPRVAIENVMNGVQALERIVLERFNVTYHYNGLCSRCNSSGGICGTDLTNMNFICHCDSDHSEPYACSVESVTGGWNLGWKAIIGSISGGIGILFVLTTICYINGRSNNSHIFLLSFLQSEKRNNQDIEAFMKNHGSLVPTRYSYTDVRKITNLFKEKLGQGGFGTVYKGKLLDGRLVAVKMLNETKGNGEEFINEVASISRTSHVNVVNLLGFCFERHKRALIYEFMPNGSLDKFVGSEKHQNNEQHLGWEKLYQIALGVARGLEYLHRGCNTRIVHFDIKPHNILLDKDFFPKIADFGLAKLCTREKSILSMLEARGTIGYIAPEVFSRNFGGVSHKSDVYSYGMMLLEIVGEKRKDDSVASDSSETYFPYWVYKHVELNKFGDLGVSAVEDIEMVRKMAIVGLWCIQTNPSDRPSMSKVIEMFERNIEILEVPPKPFLFSPTRSASDSCTLSLS